MTMLLGDLGANVIKVESPEGDGTRSWGPPWVGETSTYYAALNRNKKSVVLDLNDPYDRVLARTLATEADIVVENFLPGKMEQFGLDYETISTLSPKVIYCSISGYGTDGAVVAWPGYDILAQAASGLMSITGSPESEPQKVGVAVVDVLSGVFAGLGVMAALVARDRDGLGQRLEVDLFGSAMAALTNQTAAYLLAGVVPERLGNRHPSVVPYETFGVADGQIVIAAGTDRQFQALCVCVDAARLGTDPRFARNEDRVKNRDVLLSELRSYVRLRTRDELTRDLRAHGVPCGPVNTIAEAFAFARDAGIPLLWDVDGQQHVRAPFRLQRTPPRPCSAAPGLDASGTSVRGWLAGLVEARTS